MTRFVPDAERVSADLNGLSTIVEGDHPGWTRTAFGPAYADGRDAVRRAMTEAGLTTTTDAAGNIIGRLEGRADGGRALMVGSHTDTVVGGGRFDGTVGVFGAIEAVRLLRENDAHLEHDLLVVDFFNEEPTEFGLSCVGSRAMTGRLTPDQLRLQNAEGRTLGDALRSHGFDPGAAATDLGHVDAFVELHIEQGPFLERDGSRIGLVESITGIARFRALFRGQADHAGTTPMSSRRDAGCAAAGTVLAVERIAGDGVDTKGTCGQVTFTPEAVNVVSEHAGISGELRGPEAEWLTHAQHRLTEAAHDEGGRRGVGVDVEWLPLQRPMPLDESVSATVAQTVESLGMSISRLFSGAEHDAAFLAREVPAAMLFVPSVDGRSHCPQEWTDVEDICAGITALTESLVALDSRRR